MHCVLQIDSKLVSQHHDHKSDVAELERDVALRLTGFLCFWSELMVQLTSELSNLLGKTSEVHERRKISLLELPDVLVDFALDAAELHDRSRLKTGQLPGFLDDRQS